MKSLMKGFGKTRGKLSGVWMAAIALVSAFALMAPSMAGAVGLEEAFDPKTTGEDLLTKLGPAGIAVVSVFVAVFIFTVGLHFFRRHGKSVAK